MIPPWISELVYLDIFWRNLQGSEQFDQAKSNFSLRNFKTLFFEEYTSTWNII